MHQKVGIIHMEVWQMLPSVNKQHHSSEVLCYSILVWYDKYCNSNIYMHGMADGAT